MPGEYFIKLTYSNGTTKIMNSDGTLISIDKYKSTIVTSGVTKNALGNGNNTHGNEWYKYLEGNNYSVAVDSLSIRQAINKGDTRNNMIAGTAKIDITIENTESNYNGEEVEGSFQANKFEGFNLGIIEMPKQDAKIENIITNVKLTNTPTVVFDGNPESDKMAGVTDLDDEKNGGSTYARMEVEEENIYGSDLDLTYNVKVTNTSDINYYEIDDEHYGWYYMFGEHDDKYSREMKLNVENVVDCYDNVLLYGSADERIANTEYNTLAGTWGDKDIDNSVKVQQQYAKVDNFEHILKISGWGDLARNESKDISFEMNKVLSTGDADLNFLNVAGIAKSSLTVSSEDADNQTALKSVSLFTAKAETNPASSEAIVSPPTGSNQLMLIVYPIIGITILAIVATGVAIIIRKKK